MLPGGEVGRVRPHAAVVHAVKLYFAAIRHLLFDAGNCATAAAIFCERPLQ